MGIQFRLGPGDHKPVEDFLARDYGGTTAITLDTKAARRQQDAAAAAIDAGLHVYWEPATERLTTTGYGLDKYPLWIGSPYDTEGLSTDARRRQRLVEATLDAHPSAVTHLTAPHFYVTNDRAAHLNVDLAERTRLRSTTKPTRAVLTISTLALGHLSVDLPAEYAAAGIDTIEIRLSPFGGDDESLRKIRKAFGFLHDFRERGVHVTLGQSGNIGQTALALGYADAYSVGVGMLEKVNHAQTLARYRRKPIPTKTRAVAQPRASTCPGSPPPSQPPPPASYCTTPTSAPASDAAAATAATASPALSTIAEATTCTPEPATSPHYSHDPNPGAVQWKSTV
jgi:hypothetical protein